MPFNLFLEKTMQKTLHDHTNPKSIFTGERPICNLQFADEIDFVGGGNGELQDLTDSSTEQRPMEWKSAQIKSKIMTNSMNNISTNISMNGMKLQEVTSFEYLGTTLYKDGTCSAEVHIRIASAVAAMARLNRIRRCNTASLASKFKLCKSLVTSILLYGCETWTPLADRKKDPGFSNMSLRKLLPISHLGDKTND